MTTICHLCLSLGEWTPRPNPKRPASLIYLCPACVAEVERIEKKRQSDPSVQVTAPVPAAVIVPEKNPIRVGVGVVPVKWKP
jgi:hypothetical protein